MSAAYWGMGWLLGPGRCLRRHRHDERRRPRSTASPQNLFLGARAASGRAGCPERGRELGELAEQRAGVTWIDDLLDHERLGGAERRLRAREPGFDLGP